MPFPEPLRERIDAIVAGSENKQSALIPVLREVQNKFGYLSNESMEEAAEILGIPPSSVQNVASFYTMFFRKPVGQHVIWVCRTLSCALRGAGKITIMEAECLASCGTAPVMLVDDKLEENLTKEKVDTLIEELMKS